MLSRRAIQLERWTAPGNAWTKPTVLPTSRIRVGVTADARRRIFTMGGIAADGSRLFSRVEVYRPDSGSRARADDLPSKRFMVIGASTPDSLVWAMGGYDQFGSPSRTATCSTPADLARTAGGRQVP